MDINERIEQFKTQCEQDPDNDMAHFSLGGACSQAGRHAEAAQAYLKCIQINAYFSKAYQLAGAALIESGDKDSAAEILEKGYKIAAERGDMMPQKGIAELLETIGRPVPKTESRADAQSAPGGGFVCQRTGRPGTKLPRAPFRGAIGSWIQENISKETFDEWIGLGTKIINELRLDLSKEPDDAVYDYGMRRYIGLTDEKYEELTNEKPPEAPVEYTELIDTILLRSGQVEDFGGELHRKV